MVNFWISTEK